MSVVNQHQHDPEHGAEKAQSAGQFQGGQQVGRGESGAAKDGSALAAC